MGDDVGEFDGLEVGWLAGEDEGEVEGEFAGE